MIIIPPPALRLSVIVAFLLALALLLAGCGGHHHSNPGEPQWTFLVYLNADNSLESYGIGDMNEMEMVGSSAQVNVVVQFDRTGAPGSDSSNDDWTDCRRYLVTKDSDSQVIHSPVLQYMGEVDMGNPQTLTDFIEWAKTNYPAENYALVIWNHGSGWRDRSLMAAKGVSWDDTSGTFINTPQLGTALQGQNLNLVAFDACLMSMIEVAYQIRTDAQTIMVGSEELAPADGYPYDLILQPLHDNPSMTPGEFASVIVNQDVDSYVGYYATQSAVDLSKIGPVASAADLLAQALQANSSTYAAEIASARDASQHYQVYPEYDFRDAHDFAQRVKQAAPAPDITAAADALTSAITNSVLLEKHTGASVADSHGLSIYIPASSGFDTPYSQLAFAQDTAWDEFLLSQTQ